MEARILEKKIVSKYMSVTIGPELRLKHSIIHPSSVVVALFSVDNNNEIRCLNLKLNMSKYVEYICSNPMMPVLSKQP